MRKITRQSVSAFLGGRNFKKQNMEVITSNNGTTVNLLLHGNKVAWYVKGTTNMFISNCGWKSNTTKERLNALPNVSIQQKQGTWYLNGEIWDGKMKDISL